MLSSNSFLFIILIIIASCTNGKQENQKEQKSKAFHCLLDSLKPNDTLFIHYQTTGCEHHFTEEIRMYRKADSLFAAHWLFLPETNRSFPPLIHALADSSMLAYAEFEKAGKTLKTGMGCTTNEKYMICLRSDTIRFEDNGCAFDGYYVLKNKLFGEAVMEHYRKQAFGY